MGSKSTSAFKMCFSQEMSGMFSVLGALFALWVAKTNGNSNVVKGVMYFVAMETLQFVQYMFIATDVDPAHPTLSQIEASPTCKSSANRFLTFLGVLRNLPNWIAGTILFATGPFMADWITPNKQEAASIWCFFSIMQVVGLACILILNLHSRGRWFPKASPKTKAQ